MIPPGSNMIPPKTLGIFPSDLPVERTFIQLENSDFCSGQNSWGLDRGGYWNCSNCFLFKIETWKNHANYITWSKIMLRVKQLRVESLEKKVTSRLNVYKLIYQGWLEFFPSCLRRDLAVPETVPSVQGTEMSMVFWMSFVGLKKMGPSESSTFSTLISVWVVRKA